MNETVDVVTDAPVAFLSVTPTGLELVMAVGWTFDDAEPWTAGRISEWLEAALRGSQSQAATLRLFRPRVLQPMIFLRKEGDGDWEWCAEPVQTGEEAPVPLSEEEDAEGEDGGLVEPLAALQLDDTEEGEEAPSGENGHQPELADELASEILAVLKERPLLSVAEVLAELQASGASVSSNTVRRRLYDLEQRGMVHSRRAESGPGPVPPFVFNLAEARG